jgi:hypothetical protein
MVALSPADFSILLPNLVRTNRADLVQSLLNPERFTRR